MHLQGVKQPSQRQQQQLSLCSQAAAQVALLGLQQGLL
jgi:hypothetical protein